MENKKTPRKITLTVRTIDHWRETRHYKTLKGARKFAHRVVGPHPDLGGGYAVSFYGDTVLVFDGASYNELFPAPVEPPATTWDDLEAYGQDRDPDRYENENEFPAGEFPDFDSINDFKSSLLGPLPDSDY
jgi:hypothetical protein